MAESLPSWDVNHLSHLSVPERLDLIGRIWDSIPDSQDALPMPEWHQQELDRRLASAEANPGANVPWEQVKARLRGQS
jgi:putative addiction module component (TIGR02574 family)